MDHSDLADIFGMTMPWIVLFVRGSVMYWFLVLVFRLILRRDVFWNVVIDWATYRWPAVERLFAAKRLLLVRNGKRQRRNMRREWISDAELMSKVREEGLEDLSRVKFMYLESDGEISLIRQPGAAESPPPKQSAKL